MDCSQCGKHIEDSYVKVLDNFLQIKYFETDKLNCFCSRRCLCDYIMAEEIFIEEEAIE